MVLMEVKEVLGSPRTGVMDGEPPCGCWGLNLQELGVLLVSESSLQTLEGLSLEDSPQNLCLTLRLWKQTAGTRAQTVMPSEFYEERPGSRKYKVHFCRCSPSLQLSHSSSLVITVLQWHEMPASEQERSIHHPDVNLEGLSTSH